MRFLVERPMAELFPSAVIGVVRGENARAREDFAQHLARLRTSALEALRRTVSVETLAEHSHVAAWRDAYRKFGVNPKKHKPTHESLARRLLTAGTWPSINPIVDLYLVNQAEFLLPHGGYDLAKLSGTLRLTRSAGGERFEPLGGGEETTDLGEVVYRDDLRILTRRWNCRDCEAAKITDATDAFLLMMESPSDAISAQAIATACAGLVEKCRRAMLGSFTSAVLDAGALLSGHDIS